jgi:hypothetical protein
MEAVMTTLWKEALHAWLTEPRMLRLSDLPVHIQRDVGLGPETCLSTPEPIRSRDSRPEGMLLGLQMSR